MRLYRSGPRDDTYQGRRSVVGQRRKLAPIARGAGGVLAAQSRPQIA